MTAPQTLVVRTFTDRAEGLSHFVLRAGEAPRLLAFDDALGCPVETALAALEWSGAVGVLLDDDLLHAARFERLLRPGDERVAREVRAGRSETWQRDAATRAGSARGARATGWPPRRR